MALIDANPLEGVAKIAESARGILGMIWPDKTEVEKAQLAASFALITAQTDINKAEAQSTDPLQHWRGGMGWTCVAGYFYNFVAQPLIVNVADILHTPIALHPLDIAPLVTLTLGMLGIGALHVAENK